MDGDGKSGMEEGLVEWRKKKTKENRQTKRQTKSRKERMYQQISLRKVLLLCKYMYILYIVYSQAYLLTTPWCIERLLACKYYSPDDLLQLACAWEKDGRGIEVPHRKQI